MSVMNTNRIVQIRGRGFVMVSFLHWFRDSLVYIFLVGSGARVIRFVSWRAYIRRLSYVLFGLGMCDRTYDILGR